MLIRTIKKITKTTAFFICGLPINKKHCSICNNHFLMFIPGKPPGISKSTGITFQEPVATALSIIGSDLSQFFCPKCQSNDRERHLALYISETNLLSSIKNKRILHFAPEKSIKRLIDRKEPKEYIRCDLSPRSSDEIKIDMENIPYDDEYFDIVIANHVLEHIPSDYAGISEIHRVLKQGGHAILQTPYSRKLVSTFEDPGIDDALSRTLIYGQNDHVRLFGLDIFNKIEKQGFLSKVSQHNDVLPNTDANIYGVNSSEPFFLFQKL